MHIETIQDVAAIFQKLLVEFIGLIFQINSLRFWLPRTRARVRWEHAERQKLQAQCNAIYNAKLYGLQCFHLEDV